MFKRCRSISRLLREVAGSNSNTFQAGGVLPVSTGLFKLQSKSRETSHETQDETPVSTWFVRRLLVNPPGDAIGCRGTAGCIQAASPENALFRSESQRNHQAAEATRASGTSAWMALSICFSGFQEIFACAEMQQRPANTKSKHQRERRQLQLEFFPGVQVLKNLQSPFQELERLGR